MSNRFTAAASERLTLRNAFGLCLGACLTLIARFVYDMDFQAASEVIPIGIPIFIGYYLLFISQKIAPSINYLIEKWEKWDDRNEMKLDKERIDEKIREKKADI